MMSKIMFEGETTTMTPPEADVSEIEVVYDNPQGFHEINVEKFEVTGTRLLVQWLEANDVFKAGKIKLVRPETHKAAHFTGNIVGIGKRATTEDWRIGQRIFFQQFAGFNKLFDPKYGRLALIQDTDAMLILPSRVKVESMDGDYDYDA